MRLAPAAESVGSKKMGIGVGGEMKMSWGFSFSLGAEDLGRRDGRESGCSVGGISFVRTAAWFARRTNGSTGPCFI